MHEGRLFAFPPAYVDRHEIDSTMVAVKQAIEHGMGLLSFHDIFNYLGSVMHYADCNRDADEHYLEDVFGKVDFQSDVLQPGFLALAPHFQCAY